MGPQPEPVQEAQAVEEPVVAAYKGVMEPAVDYSYLPYAQNYEYYGAAVSAPVVSKPVVASAPVAVAPVAPAVQQVQVAPVQVAPVAQAVVPVVQAVSTDGTQYHSQDDIGQYSFGYANGDTVKQEVKTADGVVRGAYQYVDANGIVQTVNYIADALGFRVGATNLPVHHVEGAAAEPVQEVQAVEEPVIAAYKGVMEPAVDYSYLPYATSYGYNLPAPHVVAAPAVQQVVQPVVQAAPVPIVTAQTADLTNSQYHAQDDLGQYNYGYSSPTSTKQELKTADGVTRGSYSYVDANGLVQTVNYISDALGFKVAATNLPVHHVEGPAAEPVQEVLAVEEPVVAAYKGVMEPAVDYSYLPYAQNYGYYGAAVSAPVPVVDTTYSNVVSKPVVASVPVAPVAQAV